MPPRKKADPVAPVFDLSQFREAPHYVWREIDREDGEPIRVKLLDLSIRQTNAIPWAGSTPMREIFGHIAPYVAEWDFKAENIETGELVDVPPPSVLGGEVFELLPSAAGTAIAMWLKTPWAMRAADTKKASTPSTSTTEPPNTSD